MFSNDTTLYITILATTDSQALNQHIARLQLALDRLHAWFTKWRLDLAPTKTKMRLFVPRGTPHDAQLRTLLDSKCLRLGNTPLGLDPEPATRYLGLWFDDHLTFSHHLQRATAKAEKRLAVIKWLASPSRGGRRGILLALFRSWLRPVLEYGACAFGGLSGKDFERCDRLQLAAIRLALGVNTISSPIAAFIEADEALPLQRRLAAPVNAILRSIAHPTDTPLKLKWREFQSATGLRHALPAGVADRELYYRSRAPPPGINIQQSPFEVAAGVFQLCGIPNEALASIETRRFWHPSPPWTPPTATHPDDPNWTTSVFLVHSRPNKQQKVDKFFFVLYIRQLQ